ncbi:MULTISPECIES: glutaredoxin family protein [Anoxybacillus]|uniref:glutaredoxin family protein n=1 Tax=Anoxybacillus TaxID=150247 RepID=UPI000386C6F2|nr:MULTISPECIES: glutaredoxin family protein [Anoxybacillus]EPZ39881.1 glutaredoxin-like protein [Anoxybacillus ayderensis]NNU96263.1 glutaredoxin family protein [Anoxybacillus sp. EFIL]
MKVIVYSKENCCLCDEAKAILRELQVEWEEVDIYKDEQLLEQYHLIIPVIEVDGEMVAYGRIHKDVIRKRLQKKRSS